MCQLGVILFQEQKLVAFFSRTLTDTQKSYTTNYKELLSNMETLKGFRMILMYNKIRVYTNHKIVH